MPTKQKTTDGQNDMVSDTPTKTSLQNGLMDYNCVVLDGKCNCKFESGRSASDGCKYLNEKSNALER